MILSEGKYPFGTIITRMSDGDLAQFVVSTAKEGLLKGLTTCVQLPPGSNIVKVFYMPSLNKDAIHLIHRQLVASIEEHLSSRIPFVVIIDHLAESLKASPYTLEVVIDAGLKAVAAEIRSAASGDSGGQEEDDDREDFYIDFGIPD